MKLYENFTIEKNYRKNKKEIIGISMACLDCRSGLCALILYEKKFTSILINLTLNLEDG